MFKVSAPGKIILHGEHSVVYGKTAIAASIGVRTRASIDECGDGSQIIVNLKNLGIAGLSFNYAEIDVPSTEWTRPETLDHQKYYGEIKALIENNSSELNDRQIQSIVIVLYAFRGIIGGRSSKNIEVSVETDLEIGSGVGSSASYSVATVAVMLHYLRTIDRDYGEFSAVEFNAAERKLVSDWAYNCEKITHSNPSGIDNAVCTYGSLVEFKKGSQLKLHPVDAQIKICLIDTHVTRNTKQLVEKVAVLRDNHPEIVDNVLSAMDHVSIEALAVIGDLSQNAGSFKKLAELFDLNHSLLRALDVSHDTLEDICTTCKRLGFSSKLTGAGGGGFAIALIPPTTPIEECDTLVSKLSSHGYTAKIIELGAEGVKIE